MGWWRVWTVAMVGVLVGPIGGCGGCTDEDDDGVIYCDYVLYDARPEADAADATPPDDAFLCPSDESSRVFDDASPANCDPVGQTGCLVGEKCAAVLLSPVPGEETYFLACVPEGSHWLRQRCCAPEVSRQSDDCAAGLHCMNGVCFETCYTDDDCSEVTCQGPFLFPFDLCL